MMLVSGTWTIFPPWGERTKDDSGGDPLQPQTKPRWSRSTAKAAQRMRDYPQEGQSKCEKAGSGSLPAARKL